MTEISDTAKKIQPFWGRVALLPSPVDEYQRASGLVVPDKYEGEEGIHRGIVIAVDDGDGFLPIMHILEVGMVVWHLGGYTVRDTVIVRGEDIIAYEADA